MAYVRGVESSLDALIRQQNEAVLGTSDNAAVLGTLHSRQARGPVAASSRPQPKFVAQPPPFATESQYQEPSPPQPAHQQRQFQMDPMGGAPGYGGAHPAFGASAAREPPPQSASPRAAAVHTSVRVSKDPSAINSSQMDRALHPMRSDRDALKRAGLQPHNHHRDNVTKIRELQLESAAKKAEADQQAQRADEQKRRVRELALNTAQRVSAVAAQAPPVRVATKPATLSKHTSYGKVPTYLAERNRAKDAEDSYLRAEAEKRAGCPPGTRLVTEEERAQVLQTIATREAELRKELQSLPFVVKTVSTANKKKALEDRLDEIEGAHTQYSKPRVYVALE
ncbi:calmodulin-binding-domain-containing protein [Pavlovales sp. CCMP2436]|nr:calmodulin-binding-domain-containing protein [Pavlovales sp. CCMP2436]